VFKMKLTFEPPINISSTPIINGVHFQSNEAQFFYLSNGMLYGQTTPTVNGAWRIWDINNQTWLDPGFYQNGLMLNRRFIENMDMSHIPRSGLYVVWREDSEIEKHMFGVYIGSYGHQDMLWETPETDMGSPEIVKKSNDLYLTLEGKGWIKVECIFDGSRKEKIIEIPEEEKVLRVRFRHKGRLIKLKITNIIGSQIVLKNPIFRMDTIED